MNRAVVIEPFTHPAPTGEGWCEGLRECGWAVVRHRDSDPLVGIPSGLVVVFDTPDCYLDKWIRNKIRPSPSTQIVVVVSDTPHFDIAAVAPYVSLFVSHTLRHDALDARFAAAGAKLHHLPLAGRRFFAETPRQEPVFDVCFIGSFWHGDRGQDLYIKPLMEAGLRLFLAGCYGKPSIPYRDTARTYERTKIGVNFHYPYQKEETRRELNGRTFDLALAGCFQVSDHEEAARAGLVVSPTQPQDWLKRIQSILENPASCREFADWTRGQALEYHTWGARMREMLALLDSVTACEPQREASGQ